jgi:hypothetical protein
MESLKPSIRAASPNPTLAQFVAMDDVFARYPVLTLVHILPGLLFVVFGPLQFSSTFRKRHLQWHRRSGRILFLCGAVIGVSALVMSFSMPSIGGVNQAAATTLFSLWFLFAQGKAFRHIHRREIALRLIVAEVWIRRTPPQTTALPIGGGGRKR